MTNKIIGLRVNKADIDDINIIRRNIYDNNSIVDTSTAVRFAIRETSRLITQGQWPNKTEAN